MKSAYTKKFGNSVMLLFILIIGTAQLHLLPGRTEGSQSRYRQDRIIAKPRANLANLHGALGCQVLRSYPRFGGLQVIHLPEGAKPEDIIERYRNSGLVEYAEFDHIVLAADLDNTSNDPGYTNGILWGLNNTGQAGGTPDADIDAPEGWHYRCYANETIVGVIDWGVRYTHEDLAANMWHNPREIPGNGQDDDGNGYTNDVYGINAINGSGNPNDETGHGTHIAGTIGGVGNNAVGVVGVSWRVQIMALKFGGDTSDAIECINYALDKGAHVINASWGCPDFNQGLLDVIRVTANSGVLFVACAHNTSWYGNPNNDLVPIYPASYDLDNIVAVAATTRTDGLANYSHYGLVSVDLGAPGGDYPIEVNGIYSTWYTSDTAYDWSISTSMATPHVSGALAMLRSQFPAESYLQLINRLLSNTDATGTMRFYRARTTTISSCNAVGYVDITITANVDRMIANPLNAVDNRVSVLLPDVPNNTKLYKWDDVIDQFIINTFRNGAWTDPNMTLAPGEGVIFQTGSTYTKSFVGEILQGYLMNSV
jgi:subtilisin family serine protease